MTNTSIFCGLDNEAIVQMLFVLSQRPQLDSLMI
jgi:hypothetical protein